MGLVFIAVSSGIKSFGTLLSPNILFLCLTTTYIEYVIRHCHKIPNSKQTLILPVHIKSQLSYAAINEKVCIRKLYAQFCRIKRIGGAGCPPPIIFERLKLPQQIIYRRKGNLSERPNHQKYWKNILISRFYEQFSRSNRILGHFGSSKKFQTLRTLTYHISF